MSSRHHKTIAASDKFTTHNHIYTIITTMNRYDQEEAVNKNLVVTDGQGNTLENGDAAFITQDLPVKGMKPIKRGAILKNIRIKNDAESVDGKIDGTSMIIKTCYLKKKK